MLREQNKVSELSQKLKPYLNKILLHDTYVSSSVLIVCIDSNDLVVAIRVNFIFLQVCLHMFQIKLRISLLKSHLNAIISKKMQCDLYPYGSQQKENMRVDEYIR